MPVYEYECLGCGKRHEIVQKISEKPLKTCPECRGRLKKLISNTSFVLKGTGWYATDYASPERKKAVESESKPTDKSPGTKDAKNEQKPEKKTPSLTASPDK
jgi:putative FmdB family regulatory protein